MSDDYNPPSITSEPLDENMRNKIQWEHCLAGLWRVYTEIENLNQPKGGVYDISITVEDL